MSPPHGTAPFVTVAAHPIRVTLARFEDIVAVGLQALIEGDSSLALVSTDVDGDALTVALARDRPDVAILNFGSLSSPAALRDLAARNPDTRLLVLANNPTGAEGRQVIGFGATACLAKSTEARDVLHAIHLASRGMQVLPGAADGEPTLSEPGPAPLTEREADVLSGLQDGRSNAEIAADLHVGVETVRTHARRIYRKLGVSTRRELRPPAS